MSACGLPTQCFPPPVGCRLHCTGAKQLQAAIAQQDAVQLASLRDNLLSLQEQGTPFAEDGWPAHLLRTEKRYLDILDDWRVRAREFYGGTPRETLVPRYVPSQELDRLVVPKERCVGCVVQMVDRHKCNVGNRLVHPLADDAVACITREFGAPHLLELVARARRRSTGASFPRETI